MSRNSKMKVLAIILCVVAFSVLVPQEVQAEWSQDCYIRKLYGDIGCVARYDGDIIIGGYFWFINGKTLSGISRWDGEQWTTVGTGEGFKYENGPGRIRDLIVYNGDLYASGSFDEIDGIRTRGIAVWNGKEWSAVGGGIGAPFSGSIGGVGAMMIYNGDLVVGGNFVEIGGLSTNNMGCWNGTEWSKYGSGTPHIVHCLTEFNGQLYAGGATTHPDPQIGHAVWVWTGQTWSSIAHECAGIGVLALTEYDGHLVAGGVAFFSGNSLAYLNGNVWEEYAGGLSYHAEVRDLEVFKGNLIVSGRFDYVDGDPLNEALSIARWDGDEWHDFDYGLWRHMGSPYVQNIELDGDGLLAAGYFDRANTPPGTSMTGVAVWTEDTIDINLKSVSALQIPDLFGGAAWKFTWKTDIYSDPLLDKVVVRDCSQTSPGCMIGQQVFVHNEIDVITKITLMNDGTYLHDMTVTRRECSPGCEYLFDVSSTEDGYTVASTDNDWNTGPCIGAPIIPPIKSEGIASAARTELEQNHPNPFNPSTAIGYTIANGVNVKLAIYDVTGKLVRTLVNEFQGQSSYRVTWDGKDNAGSQVASGAYFYRLETPTFTETRKLLLLK